MFYVHLQLIVGNCYVIVRLLYFNLATDVSHRIWQILFSKVLILWQRSCASVIVCSLTLARAHTSINRSTGNSIILFKWKLLQKSKRVRDKINHNQFFTSFIIIAAQLFWNVIEMRDWFDLVMTRDDYAHTHTHAIEIVQLLTSSTIHNHF